MLFNSWLTVKRKFSWSYIFFLVFFIYRRILIIRYLGYRVGLNRKWNKIAKCEVRWFNYKKGYGFLSQEGKEDSDIFVHISAVKDSDVKRLEKGQIVEYDIQEQDNGKSAAANIKILQEAPEESKEG